MSKCEKLEQHTLVTKLLVLSNSTAVQIRLLDLQNGMHRVESPSQTPGKSTAINIAEDLSPLATVGTFHYYP